MPHMECTYCFRHRHALATKETADYLQNVLSKAVKFVNFIKNLPLTTRLLSTMYEELDDKNNSLFFHTESDGCREEKFQRGLLNCEMNWKSFLQMKIAHFWSFCKITNLYCYWLTWVIYFRKIWQTSQFLRQETWYLDYTLWKKQFWSIHCYFGLYLTKIRI